MPKNNVYITTTLPYVNAEPHIGFALEIVQADAFARYQRLLGSEVFFNFGTDEHGLKIYRKAKEQGKDPQTYTDEYSEKFDDLKKSLNLSYNNFIRTTNPEHKKAAQEFWKICHKNGYIYKKLYKSKYCVGCELEKTDSELVDGKCPIHPSTEIEIIEEENYFFKFSEFENKLLELYDNNPAFVIPSFRLKEIKTFVEGGLNDFSISRLREKLPWGVEVPGDPNHVMYVWFDALINYISAIGWPDDSKSFEKWWPVIQFAGKDNLRQQSAIWQAMLMAAGLPPSQQIVIHGFISMGGQKISKSLGNSINPYELVAKYGTDAVRYFLLSKIHPFKDGDFTYDKFEESYNSDLANGLGNTVARVAKLAEKAYFSPEHKGVNLDENYSKSFAKFKFNEVLELLWKKLKGIDRLIDRVEPWKFNVKDTDESVKLKTFLQNACTEILDISYHLKPILPETSKKVQKQFNSGSVKSQKPLFPRLDK